MRFMIGYQMTADNRFLSLMLRNKEKIGEVYFAWPDIPSGRGTMKSGKSLCDTGKTAVRPEASQRCRNRPESAAERALLRTLQPGALFF